MVKLIHHNVIVKLRACLACEILRIESLDGHEQIINTLRHISADKHLPKILILQNATESIHTLLQNFFSVCNEKQTARLIRILLAKTLIVKCGNDRFSRARSRYNKVSILSAHGTFCFKFIKNLLLIGIWCNVKGVRFGIVAIKILFRFQRTRKAFSLPLVIIFKFSGIPVALKCCNNLINRFGQVFLCNFYIPFKPGRNSRIG